MYYGMLGCHYLVTNPSSLTHAKVCFDSLSDKNEICRKKPCFFSRGMWLWRQSSLQHLLYVTALILPQRNTACKHFVLKFSLSVVTHLCLFFLLPENSVDVGIMVCLRYLKSKNMCCYSQFLRCLKIMLNIYSIKGNGLV